VTARADFQGRYGPWALVAGASAGLGAEFSRQLAGRGLNVALVARRAPPLEALAGELRASAGVETRAIVADLADPASPGRIAERMLDVDVGLLVCNAAFAPAGAFLERPLEDHLRAVDVNVRAPLALCRLLLPGMVSRGRGGVVVMSSLSALQGSPFLATYGAGKAFQLSLAEALWYELRESGVAVVDVCAGAIRTPGFEEAAPGGAPGVLEPHAVVRAALEGLGTGPEVVPGALNRVAAFAMRRLLPRRTAIAMMGARTRRLQ
jgi:short-subunit dehydrogenase